MNTKKRVIVVSAAAVAGLFLAGCDNTDTEETPEAPAETTMQMDEGATATAGDDGDDAGGDGDDAGDDGDDIGD